MEYLLHILILIGIYVIAAVSLNVVAGYTGLPSAIAANVRQILYGGLLAAASAGVFRTAGEEGDSVNGKRKEEEARGSKGKEGEQFDSGGRCVIRKRGDFHGKENSGSDIGAHLGRNCEPEKTPARHE
jgi:hypothetical protein